MERWLAPLNSLRAFSIVARHNSFTMAADAMNISQSALSRHVILLEETFKKQLFERKNKSIALTDAGKILLEGVNKGFEHIENALMRLERYGSGNQPRLRVNLPPSFAMKMAVPLLMDFKNNFPDCVLEISTPYGQTASDFDIGVVYGRPCTDEWVEDLLWEERVVILCHASLALRTVPSGVAGFLGRNEIIHVRIVDEDPYYTWKRFAIQNNLPASSVERGVIVDTASLAVNYVASGQGLALVDPMLFQDEIESGHLIVPFVCDYFEGYGYYLRVKAESLKNPLIAAFRVWLIRKFKNKIKKLAIKSLSNSELVEEKNS